MADVEAYVMDVRVTFARDASGNVTHFPVSSSRVKGLAFNKIDAVPR